MSRLSAPRLPPVFENSHFNVNVTLGAGGLIIGGSGGHSDTAAGAKLALVTTQLTDKSHPKIVDRVACITTPGETIDVVVTDEGVAVNPKRPDLRDRLLSEGVSLVSIEELREKTKRRTDDASKENVGGTGRVVAVAEYRDGTVIDVIEGIDG